MAEGGGDNAEEAGYSWLSAYTPSSSSVFAQAQSWYNGDETAEASPTESVQQNGTKQPSSQGSPLKNPMLRRSRTSISSQGYKDGANRRRSEPQALPSTPNLAESSETRQTGNESRRAGELMRAAAHSARDTNQTTTASQSPITAAAASLYGAQGQAVQQPVAPNPVSSTAPDPTKDDGYTLSGLWGAATVAGIWKGASDLYGGTGISAADRELERALRQAIANGADAASEYWAAHNFAADQTLELQLLEQTMSRYGRAGLQNELREAETLADQALQSASDAQELLQNARRQEEGVADSIEQADSKAARMDLLSQGLHQNYESEFSAMLSESATKHDEIVDEYDRFYEEYEQIIMIFEEARRQRDDFLQERMLADDADIRARRLVAHSTVSHREAQEEIEEVQQEYNISNSELKAWSGQRSDITASLQVSACLIEALEADADHSGKVASSEILEAQQMQKLVQAETRQAGFYEDECDRLIREIRDLSRHQRARPP